MGNTNKTKRLLIKKIKELEPVETAQQKVVDDLNVKLIHAQQYYNDAVAKLDEIKDTIKDYKKDKGK